MSWEDDFRRNIERTRQRIMEIAPDMLDLGAHRAPEEPRRGPAPNQYWTTTRKQNHPIPSSPRTDKTHDIDPGRPGPYPVCQSPPVIFAKAADARDAAIVKDIPLIAYAPGSMADQSCASAIRDCPTFVLFHARPTAKQGTLPEFYKAYSALCTHVASHGYVALSIGWGANDVDPSKIDPYATFLMAQLEKWLAGGGLNLKSITNKQLALFGHSIGGVFAVAAANAPFESLELESVTLMSPASDAINSYDWAKLIKLPSARSFLGIHTKTDSDPSSCGGPANNYLTIASDFEVVGATSDPLIFSVRRHLIFAHGDSGDHFYQSEAFVLGYIVAHLQRHLRHLTYFDRFILHQKRIPSAGSDATFQHLHEDKKRKIAFHWSGLPEFQVAGATKHSVGSLKIIDKYAINPRNGLRIESVRGKTCKVRLFFKAEPFFFWDAPEYEYLSVAMCQSHVPDSSLKGPAPVLPIVTVWAGGQSVSVDLAAEAGRYLKYPSTYVYPQLGDLTRTCLDEFLIRVSWLSKFLNLVGMSSLEIDFSNALPSGDPMVILIGEVKLIGYGG